MSSTVMTCILNWEYFSFFFYATDGLIMENVPHGQHSYAPFDPKRNKVEMFLRTRQNVYWGDVSRHGLHVLLE